MPRLRSRHTPEGNIWRRPKTPGGLLYFLLLALCLTGLTWTLVDWRQGVSMVGTILVLGAVVRVALGEYDAGMLRVRSRWFDVGAMAGVGVLLIFLAATIPNQPV